MSAESWNDIYELKMSRPEDVNDGICLKNQDL